MDRAFALDAALNVQAEAVLKLRSLKISGDLAAYLACHFEQERNRNLPGPIPLPLAALEAVGH